MKAKFKKLMKNQKGMTLIELLAVIVIIAIIALIAIPAIGNIINNSKDKAILSDASQIISSTKIAIADGACDGTSTTGTTACNQDTLKDYVEKEGITGNFLVTKDGSKYTITYEPLKSMKGKLKGNTELSDGVIESDKLAKLMGNE